MSEGYRRSLKVFLCYRHTDGRRVAQAIFDAVNDRPIDGPEGNQVNLEVFFDQRVGGVANWKDHHRPALELARALILVVTPGIAADLSRRGKPDWVQMELR